MKLSKQELEALKDLEDLHKLYPDRKSFVVSWLGLSAAKNLRNIEHLGVVKIDKTMMFRYSITDAGRAALAEKEQH